MTTLRKYQAEAVNNMRRLFIEKEIAALYDATRDETDKATVKANLERIARLKEEIGEQ